MMYRHHVLNFCSGPADNMTGAFPLVPCIKTTTGGTMSVGGSSSGVSSAIGVMTHASTSHLQQQIAAKVVRDQMESEAMLVTKLVNSGNTGARIDFRA
jgi:hypothetical protein